MTKIINQSNEEFLKNLGEFIVEKSKKAISTHGFFYVAFSGGSAATKICQCLEIKEYSDAIDFSKWKIFFCDERFVPLTNADSNYKAIFDGLIAKQSQIDQSNVFTINPDSKDVRSAAFEYANIIKREFCGCEETPSFDLIVLGMGPDGHICSLFPNHELLDETVKWMGFIENSPKPPPQRITFTMNLVNSAKNIIFITTGEGKASKVKQAIEGESTKDVPASLVKPEKGNLHWFLDKGAASLLQ